MSNDDIHSNFLKYKGALRQHYGQAVFDSWMEGLSLLSVNDQTVTLSAANEFKARTITQRFAPSMSTLWYNTTGERRKIHIKSVQPGTIPPRAGRPFSRHENPQPERKPKVPSPSAPVPPAPEIDGAAYDLAAPLSPSLTFENFCVGDCNRLAFAATRAAVEDTSEPMVYIHGASSRGKTHLLNAIGLDWYRRNPSDNILYITYDKLVNSYADAVMSRSVTDLRRFLDKIDLLLVDDVHFLRGRKATQEELLCLVDRLIARNKTVVITGNLPAVKLSETGINARLTDRMGGGMSAHIERPDYSLRLRILDQLCQQDRLVSDCNLPGNILQLIARRCDGSIREMEGAYKTIRLHARTLLLQPGSPALDEETVSKMLGEHLSSIKKEPELDAILEQTAQVFGVTPDEIKSRRRMQAIAKARHAYCLLVRKLTDAPLKQIGALTNRDHTTVLSSIDRAGILAETDAKFADRISILIDHFER